MLLYIYELINLGDRLDVRQTQHELTALWNAYHGKFQAVSGKLADWICDFSLIHRLPPPKNGASELAKKVIALKEFYIAMPEGDINGCVESLLRFCCSYDYRSSKFYKPENAELFDRYMFGILKEMVEFYSPNGRLLSALTNEDSRLTRDAYAGALCVAKEKYRIELEYCSFSRSNELRFLVGDVIKYGENQLRSVLGTKARMSVYSIPLELKARLDEYGKRHLPKKQIHRAPKAMPEYEALYNQPIKPLSLSDAKRIEEDSWSTTKDLIVAFEVEENIAETGIPPTQKNDLLIEDTPTDTKSAFGEYLPILIRVLSGQETAVAEAARDRGTLIETLVDRINEIAFDAIGDTVLEESDGGYRVVEEYRDLLE